MAVTTDKGLLLGVGALVADAVFTPLKCPGAALAFVLAARASPTRNTPRSDASSGDRDCNRWATLGS